jgi:hypothetical protein
MQGGYKICGLIHPTSSIRGEIEKHQDWLADRPTALIVYRCYERLAIQSKAEYCGEKTSCKAWIETL